MLADWSDSDVDALAGLLRRLNDTFVDHRASMFEAITRQPVQDFQEQA